MKTFIVAELGINHNGNLDICKKMIESAKKCGADAVKIQLVQPRYISAVPWLVKVQEETSLPLKDLFKAREHAERLGIEMFSSIGEVKSIKTFKKLDFKKVKISSSNLKNLPLHEEVVKLGLPVLVSTGDAFLSEIAKVVDFYKSKGADLTLLHCIAHYPTKAEEMFLRTIPYLKRTFAVPVGFSDHSEGILSSVAAVVIGAEVIEKHFTLDKKMKGPDHHFSLNPKELCSLVKQIRQTEASLGSSKDYFCKLKGWKSLVRRAIIFTQDKKAGYIVKARDLFIARPKFYCTNEIDAFDYKKIIGKKLIKAIKAFDPLTFDHV